MADEHWRKIKKIFNAALRQKPEDRRKFLERTCKGDASLREEVESLLSSYDDAESFMETAAAKEVAEEITNSGKHLEKGKIFGHYKIIRHIGAGGMGEVFLAKDTRLDRNVAVKILNEKYSRDKSNLNRFIQEAKSASALNHPNIIVIHEIGESSDAHFIVSEFIGGKTLREILNEKSFRLSEILDVSMQIANALAAAHEIHLVHRDIKPENIMIRPDGLVKILDFGLAKLVGQKAFDPANSTIEQNQTAKGVILGTVNYMSPEQAKGRRVDERTDIFSLGVCLYEMLADRTPFAGESVSETFANLINSKPQPLARFLFDVPNELERIVFKMLGKDADERYQVIKDVLIDLKNLRENLALDERLEKSHSPKDENTTANLKTATGDLNAQTGETRKYLTKKIELYRLLAGFAFIILLAAVIGFGFYFYLQKPSPTAGGKKSLAVLPFVNAGQDANAEYLSDGITDNIINNLSQLSSLKVMSRNSSFRFKDNQTDIKSIGSQLGVEIVVTGDIKQLGDKFIINVRLIDTTDDSQIWGNQYVKTSGDIIAAQNEIAQAVANNLRLKLTNAERQQLDKKYTENVEAYQLYLKGKYYAAKLAPPETQKGISYFEQAIAIDPNYAPAYVGLANAYRTLSLTGDAPSEEILPKAKAATLKALEIDDRLAEAHAHLGFIGFWYDWNWNEAENQYKLALEIDPNNATVISSYAHLKSNLGLHEEAVAMEKRARELDPLSLIINSLESQFLYFAGRNDEALSRAQKTLELDPNFWHAHLTLSRIYIAKQMYADAVAEAVKAGELSHGNAEAIATMGYALAMSGRRGAAKTVLDELKKRATERYVPPYDFALLYNGLGETVEAIGWLEKGFQERDVRMTFLKVEPKWNNLRNEPRFISLMRRMNFTPIRESF